MLGMYFSRVPILTLPTLPDKAREWKEKAFLIWRIEQLSDQYYRVVNMNSSALKVISDALFIPAFNCFAPPILREYQYRQGCKARLDTFTY